MQTTVPASAIVQLYTDLDLRIVGGSGQLEILAAHRTDIVGKELGFLFPTISSEVLSQLKAKCLENPGSSSDLEVRIGTNGHSRHLKWMVCSLQNLHGAANGFVWVGTELPAEPKPGFSMATHFAILDGVAESVILLDTDFRIRYVNKAGENLYGFTTNEVAGTRIEAHYNMRILGETRAAALNRLHQEGKWEGNYVFEKKGSAPTYISGKIIPVIEDGKITGYIAIDHDITREWLLQQENRRATTDRMLLEGIVNQSGAISWANDLGGRKLFYNDRFREATGISPTMLAPHLTDIFESPKANLYHAEDRQVILEGKVLSKVERGAEVLGKEKWYKTTKFPVVTASGTYAAGFSYDVTEEVQQKEELAYLKQRFEIAATITADIIADWDIVQDSYWRNDPVSGVPVHEQKARCLNERLLRIHPADRERFQQSLTAALEGSGQQWACEYRYQISDGLEGFKVLDEKAVILRNEAGRAVRMISVVSDITEKRKMQKELRRKEKEVIKATFAGQESERSELASELHDNVGQVLAMCKLFVEIASDTVQHEYLVKCRDHLTTAIKEIRSLSHRLSPETLNQKGLTDAVRGMAENINEAGKVRLAYELDEAVGKANVDKEVELAAYRIIQENLNNILKHAQATEANISMWLENQQLFFRICDNGKGFDPVQVKKGLGLQNIHNRVHLLGGQIQLLAAPGNGCCVQVMLPINRASE